MVMIADGDDDEAIDGPDGGARRGWSGKVRSKVVITIDNGVGGGHHDW